VLPVVVIEPWTRDVPDECTLGTRPTNAPMVLPVNRCQSPISTAKANPVNVEIPRRHPSRCTIGVNSLLAARVSIAVSRRSRRARTLSTVSWSDSKAICSGAEPNDWRRSQASCVPVQAFPPEQTMP
jgi:hypothetical protein